MASMSPKGEDRPRANLTPPPEEGESEVNNVHTKANDDKDDDEPQRSRYSIARLTPPDEDEDVVGKTGVKVVQEPKSKAPAMKDVATTSIPASAADKVPVIEEPETPPPVSDEARGRRKPAQIRVDHGNLEDTHEFFRALHTSALEKPLTQDHLYGARERMHSYSDAFKASLKPLPREGSKEVKSRSETVLPPLSPSRPHQSRSQERPRITTRNFTTPSFGRRVSTPHVTDTTSVPANGHSQTKRPPLTSSLKETQLARKLSSILQEQILSPGLNGPPLPPSSIPAHLHLELSSHKPPPFYILRDENADIPFEETSIKIERLLNFLKLPPQLESVLMFGTLACLDAWLYQFTILPLRFAKALYILGDAWFVALKNEISFLIGFVPLGLGRLWSRRNMLVEGTFSEGPTPMSSVPPSSMAFPNESRYPFPVSSTDASARHSVYTKKSTRHHRRNKSSVSRLLGPDKADLLHGLLIITSCIMLMYFDASMMYHSIRGQAAIKLYVIYNVLEVFDRLFAALGQDVLECLFSKETLERKADGRSKILRPFWLFMLALAYNIVHSTALFYQVITLNVAVNSYSNALLTLLMSNQFVEIKSTVFKRVEKENLFQMTCADIVERFQLLLMLVIIASRNVIETNGLKLNDAGGMLTSRSSIIPFSFTIFPEWAGQVLGPFMLVLGTEMLVDWVKHAYITKFNNTKPNVYARFLDVLAKDYYTNAFSDQTLIRRIGLPLIPLTCLFIRASFQTYQMFLETVSDPMVALEIPSPVSVSTGSTPSATTLAALRHVDRLFRDSLARAGLQSTFNATGEKIILYNPFSQWIQVLPSTIEIPQLLSPDSISTISTIISTLLVFLLTYFVLLAVKLSLSIILLRFARDRYAGMLKKAQPGQAHSNEEKKDKQDAVSESTSTQGKRQGAHAMVEVGEERRKWIYQDDPAGAERMRSMEQKGKEKAEKGDKLLDGVQRYAMVAKRIW